MTLSNSIPSNKGLQVGNGCVQMEPSGLSPALGFLATIQYLSNLPMGPRIASVYFPKLQARISGNIGLTDDKEILA